MAHIKIDDTTPIIVYAVGSTPTTGPFTVPFAFFSDVDLEVRLNGVLKVLNVDYSVAGKGVSEGGSITFVTAISNVTLEIKRWIPIERTTDFANSGPLPIDGINTELDRQIAIDQQIYASVGGVEARALRVPVGETVTDVPARPIRSTKALGFNSTGNPIVTDSTVAEIDAAVDQVANLEALIAGIQLGNANIVVLSSIATLRALTSTVTATSAIVQAYVADADVGGGVFRRDVTDTTTADDKGLVIVDTVGRRWKRIVGAYATLEMFGGVVADAVLACYAQRVPLAMAGANYVLQIDPVAGAVAAGDATDTGRFAVIKDAVDWVKTCRFSKDAYVEIEVTGAGGIDVAGQLIVSQFQGGRDNTQIVLSMPSTFQLIKLARTANDVSIGTRTGKVAWCSVGLIPGTLLRGTGTGFAETFSVTFVGGAGEGSGAAATGHAYPAGHAHAGKIYAITMDSGGSGYTKYGYIANIPMEDQLDPVDPVKANCSAGGGTGEEVTVEVNRFTVPVTLTLATWPTTAEVGQPVGLFDIAGSNDCAIVNGGATIKALDAGAKTITFDWCAPADVAPVSGQSVAPIAPPPAAPEAADIGNVIFPAVWLNVTGGYDGTFNGAGGFINANQFGYVRLIHWHMQYKEGPLWIRKEKCQGLAAHTGGFLYVQDISICVGFPERQVRMLSSDGYFRRLYAGGGITGQHGVLVQSGGDCTLSDGAYGSYTGTAVNALRGNNIHFTSAQVGSAATGLSALGGMIDIGGVKGAPPVGSEPSGGGLSVAGCQFGVSASSRGVVNTTTSLYVTRNDFGLNVDTGGSIVGIPAFGTQHRDDFVLNLKPDTHYKGGGWWSGEVTSSYTKGRTVDINLPVEGVDPGVDTGDGVVEIGSQQGVVTSVSLTTAAGATATIVVTNVHAKSTAWIQLSRIGGTNSSGVPEIFVSTRTTGSFTISIRNNAPPAPVAANPFNGTFIIAFEIAPIF